MNSKLKYSFITLAFCLQSLAPAFARDVTQQLADSARLAYEKQQYKSSVVYYEKILASGKNSAALHYNLGNAYFRNNQLGQAIYQYELAKKLDPADEDIKNNLRIAATKTIDKIDVKENYFVNSIRSNMYSFYTTTGWAWVTIVLTALGMLFLLLYLFSHNTLFKRLGFWTGSVSLIATVVSFCIGFGALHNKNKKSQAIITAQVVQVLNAPNTSGKSRFSLHEGTKVNVLESTDEWTSIQLDNGNEGWVKTTEVGLF